MPMKSKPQSDEYKAFEGMLGTVLSVPKAEITRRIKEDRQKKDLPSTRSQNDVPAHR